MYKGLALALGALFSMTVQAHAGHGGHGGHEHPTHAHGHAGHAHPAVPDPATAAAPQGVSVSHCWIRALPNRLPAAAYFRLKNDSPKPATLIGAQAKGYGQVMLHTHQEVNGMAAMVHVDKVVIPSGGSFDFAPRGHHVMLEQADFDLEVGTQRPIVLWFEGERALTAECEVRPAGTLK